MTDTERKILEKTEAMRNAAFEFADRIDIAADEVVAAGEKVGRHLRRVGDALSSCPEGVERPAIAVAHALDDLGREAKRSFDRIARREPPPWYSRFLR